MWWLIAPGVLGCLAVLVTAAKLSAAKHPPGRHVLESATAEELCAHCGSPALGYARGYNDERLCHHEDRDCYHQVTVYGSMIWAEERGLHGPGASTTLLPAPPPELAHEPDWREQTAADLAPEALGWPDSQVTTDGSAPGWLGAGPFSCHPWPDSGPGAALSSLTAPGPDPDWPACEHGWPGTYCGQAHPYIAEPTRLADTGDIYDAHLLADVQAYMRAQDDDARAYGSAGELGWHDFMQQYWADWAAVLA